METKQVDVLVIGAGPGGYPAAIRLAQLGKSTLLVDRHGLGGVCLNVGCIPSKALISAAKTYQKLLSAESIGVRISGDVSIDLEQLQDWKDAVVGKLTGGVATLCKKNGVELVRGEASFLAPDRVRIVAADSELEVRAPAVVVATGSRPIEIPGFAFSTDEGVLSSTSALALRELPPRLLVVGGGYIGLELGTVFQKLGSKLRVVEMTDSLLPGFDSDLVGVVRRNLKKAKTDIHVDTKALGYAKGADGDLEVELESAHGKTSMVEVDKILVTVGRVPNTEGFGLEQLGIEMDGPFIRVDRQLRTSLPGVFAIGDVAGQPMLAHKATKDAEVVAEVIAGKPGAELDVKAMPSVVFTDPEVATVGPSERELAAGGVETLVGKFPMAALGRALTNNESDGFVKTIADKESHELLAVQIVGAHASDLISEAALAIEMGAVVEDLSWTVHPHPTLGEGLMESAKVLLGEAVHALPRR